MSWVSQCAHAGDLEITGTLKKLPLEWVARLRHRKFGNVLPGEVATCRQASCLLSPSHATTQTLIALRGACGLLTDWANHQVTPSQTSGTPRHSLVG